MGIVYLREAGGMEALKVTSFHATPTGIMLTFGKNAGYACPHPSPPHVGDAHAYTFCQYALCWGVWTSLSSSEFPRIAKKGRVRVPKSLTHIPNLLFIIASRQVWSPGRANRPYLQKSSLFYHGYSFYVIVMKHVMALGHLHLLSKYKK